MRNICDSKGYVNSIYPPFEGMTLQPWIYMCPPYKPTDVLMLGYAGGTVAGQIKEMYGMATPVVAVDHGYIEDCYNVHVIKADARQWVKENKRPFDCVIVDLFEDGEAVPCAFITEEWFIAELKRFARYIIVHVRDLTDMGNYNSIIDYGRPVNITGLNRSRFYHYMVYEVPNLIVR